MTNKYLPTPCPRDDCGKMKLLPPAKSGHRFYTLCEACNRKSLYIVHDHIDGTKAFSVVPVGAPGHNRVRATFWITREQKQLLEGSPLGQSEQLRRVIDKYYDLDYNSHTLQVK